jgi:hypothetical protein
MFVRQKVLGFVFLLVKMAFWMIRNLTALK